MYAKLSETCHMIKNFPEHEIDISKGLASNKPVSVHVRVQLFELRLQVVVAVSFTLFKWS